MLHTIAFSPFIMWTRTVLRHFWLKVLLTLKSICQQCATCSYSRNNVSNSKTFQMEEEISQDELVVVEPKFKVIPEAKGLPLVGTLFELIAAGAAPQLHKYINNRHEQLGPIFRERLGGTQDCVFVASASLMRAVFRYEGQYPRHPVPDAWLLYNKTHSCQRGLFFMEGPEWLHNRRILNRLLLNGNLHWVDAHIEACTKKFLNSWLAITNPLHPDTYYEIKELEPQLYRWSIDVICSIMFGVDAINACPQHINNALEDFCHNVHKIFKYSSMLMNVPPKLAKLLRLSMWTEFENAANEVLQKGAYIIDMFLELQHIAVEEIVEKAEECNNVSLFHRLRAAGMPLEVIKRIFVDLVIAAGDTSAYTMEWALFLLAKDAVLQKRLAAHVQAEPEKMSLIYGFIKETLRLYPVAPFIGRYLDKDADLEKYYIKKNTLVLLSLYTAGRDPSHFPDPFSVRPERWQVDPGTHALQEVLQAHGSLPFAMGNRSCIGRKIALQQVSALLIAIIKHFEVKCRNAASVQSILRLVTVPSEPLQLTIKLRNNLD